MILRAENVKSLEQAQIVRSIRNECREYMTNDNRFISSAAQEKWFHSFNADLFIYYDPYNAVVGYGMINNGYGTLALFSEFRNNGYGTEIYKHLTSLCTPLRIEIFSDNVASLISALKSGFVLETMNDKTINLIYKKG